MDYVLFDTAIGACGLGWTERGLARMQLPGADRGATERRFALVPGNRVAPLVPPPVAAVVQGLQWYIAGQCQDFSAADIDLNGVEPAHRRVYEVARSIPWGSTLSYGELAARAGMPGAARVVGVALSRNPLAIIIPCHRVVGSGDKLGGFSAFGGADTKRRLLELEGARPGAAPGQGALF